MSNNKISHPVCFEKVIVGKREVQKNTNINKNNFYTDKIFSAGLFYKKIIKL